MQQSASVRFSTAVRALAGEARRHGLAVPGFRSPPRLAGADRTVRRWPDGAAVVAVRVRERPFDDVLADMVEGLLVANRLDDMRKQALRARLLRAVRAAVAPRPPAEPWRAHRTAA